MLTILLILKAVQINILCSLKVLVF